MKGKRHFFDNVIPRYLRVPFVVGARGRARKFRGLTRKVVRRRLKCSGSDEIVVQRNRKSDRYSAEDERGHFRSKVRSGRSSLDVKRVHPVLLLEVHVSARAQTIARWTLLRPLIRECSQAFFMSSFYPGKRLSTKGERCTVRYVGEVKGKQGQWLGVEWDDSTRGKHSGTRDGVEYFKCRFLLTCLLSPGLSDVDSR